MIVWGKEVGINIPALLCSLLRLCLGNQFYRIPVVVQDTVDQSYSGREVPALETGATACLR